MFECLICKERGERVIKRNLVPHIIKKHPELENGTKSYMLMFPGAKLREAPKTNYSNKDFRDEVIKKSIEKRIGKKLSKEHKDKISIGNKNSKKHKKSREILSNKYLSGEKIHHNYISIDEDVLKKLYYDENKSFNQIAKELNVSRKIVRREAEKYGIQKRKLSEAVRLVKNGNNNFKKLNKIEREVIIGNLLGDGCLRLCSGVTPSYSHTCKHIDFLLLIKSLLSNVEWSDKAISISKEIKDTKYYCLNSRCHDDFIELFNIHYCTKNGKKNKMYP